MRLIRSTVLSALSLAATALAASSWSFEDATLTVQAKGAGVGGGVKEKLSPTTPLSSTITLSATDSLKIALTTTDGRSGKKPHQAFLQLSEQDGGLQDAFAFSVKDTGKGKIEVSQKDIPTPLLTSSKPLRATLIFASFGASTPYASHLFDLTIQPDPTAPPPSAGAEKPERYAPKPEIHHIFRSDPQSPPKIISAIFTLAVLAALPVLFGAWAYLGGNVDAAESAFGKAGVAHGLFLASVVGMEGVFAMYYLRWTLFEMLPVAAVVGVVGFVSGSRALREVQGRRVAGER